MTAETGVMAERHELINKNFGHGHSIKTLWGTFDLVMFNVILASLQYFLLHTNDTDVDE